jgi:hypothetical protein
MEFFAQINKAVIPEELQKQLQIEDIPRYCSFVSEVRPDGENGLEMISFWGVHTVQRELIRGGVRFTLPGCPNVMSWTITSGLPPEPDAVVIHCVINRREHDPDFIESLEGFVEDWRAGLASGL